MQFWVDREYRYSTTGNTLRAKIDIRVVTPSVDVDGKHLYLTETTLSKQLFPSELDYF